MKDQIREILSKARLLGMPALLLDIAAQTKIPHEPSRQKLTNTPARPFWPTSLSAPGSYCLLLQCHIAAVRHHRDDALPGRPSDAMNHYLCSSWCQSTRMWRIYAAEMTLHIIVAALWLQPITAVAHHCCDSYLLQRIIDVANHCHGGAWPPFAFVLAQLCSVCLCCRNWSLLSLISVALHWRSASWRHHIIAATYQCREVSSVLVLNVAGAHCYGSSLFWLHLYMQTLSYAVALICSCAYTGLHLFLANSYASVLIHICW